MEKYRNAKSVQSETQTVCLVGGGLWGKTSSVRKVCRTCYLKSDGKERFSGIPYLTLKM